MLTILLGYMHNMEGSSMKGRLRYIVGIGIVRGKTLTALPVNSPESRCFQAGDEWRSTLTDFSPAYEKREVNGSFEDIPSHERMSAVSFIGQSHGVGQTHRVKGSGTRGLRRLLRVSRRSRVSPP